MLDLVRKTKQLARSSSPGKEIEKACHYYKYRHWLARSSYNPPFQHPVPRAAFTMGYQKMKEEISMPLLLPKQKINIQETLKRYCRRGMPDLNLHWHGRFLADSEWVNKAEAN